MIMTATTAVGMPPEGAEVVVSVGSLPMQLFPSLLSHAVYEEMRVRKEGRPRAIVGFINHQ